SELIVFLLFFGLLFINDPNVTTALIIFLSSVSFITLSAFKRIFKKKGKERNIISERINRVLNESLGNIKYIKLSNQIDSISAYFETINKRLSKINSDYMVMITLPKNILETFGLTTIVILVLYFVSSDDKNILTTFGLYIIAFYRLLPSINKIISSLNSIKFYEKSIGEIRKNLSFETEKIVKSSNIEFNDNISLTNVSFEYSGSKIFEKIDLTIKKNDHIAFIGESGSGKTTLINIITSLVSHTGGDIYVDSVRLDNTNLYSWRKKIGYIPQDVYLFDGTVAENIAFGSDKVDREKVKDLLRIVKLDSLFEGKSGLDTRVGDNAIQLSGGQKQRVAIARALYKNPEVLVLDEATSALDEKTEKDIMDDVYNICKNKTLIIIAHRLSTIDRCRRVIKLDRGVLFEKN
ncbi:ABC transporter ATP-binding protein, partial [Vibrio coralliilyticus]|uniref:ABC transporter ATP-binding protein n=2 Tax=Vibrio coralliilyticus TaxID=190893 RepID=UPI0015606F03